ncbi:PRC-barrel domain-containing protein [Azospirillum rugosum]|uniref:Sporulation protein YlmC with PRC-barrel domain/predicted RNase H-like HicB family nuclease n=1 Tax=Azospirillum rugosum TaxID=416170 RepID=A0ABS4SUI6_9PROT|nr:PRC-barrel domain-containing protein [Azospirillum rugosum]MBP2295045.1 sporulation protein YlmC with PRC-barrel domain/predicted RNase H-like HicB family nuclease [Azospirillum rugosum]MDQ0528868.1 sporulation protein YlmC with PRC-barrel domain/predicted RNase H-like HicB family nuclease [Azospirillum rugosum]
MRSKLLLTTALAIGLAAPAVMAQPSGQPSGKPAQSGQATQAQASGSQQQSPQLQQALQQLRDSEKQLQQATAQQDGQNQQQNIEKAKQQASQALQQVRQAMQQQGGQNQTVMQDLQRAEQALGKDGADAVRNAREAIALVITDVERSTQAAAGQSSASQPGGDRTRIAVQQSSPQITVQQPQPQVTVQQPPPKVTVQQSQPQVTVQQPQPQVTVQQAKPEVTVQKTGQPQVTVQQSGEPQVAVQQKAQSDAQNPPNSSSQQPANGQRQANAQQSGDQLIPAEDLQGKTVVGENGQQLGEIEDVLIDPQSKRAQKVIFARGGFLGIGEKQVAIDASKLKPMPGSDRLQLTGITLDQVKAMPEFHYDDSMVSLNRR